MKGREEILRRRPSRHPFGVGACVAALLLVSGPSGSASGPAGAQNRSEMSPQTSSADPTSGRHHLFLYLIDGLSAMVFPRAGYPRVTVPNITHLMEEGFTYTSAYSVSPWTVPSVASILTSLYPSAHGLLRAGDRLPSAARTLAEILKENGYETALFSAHPLVGPLSGLDQGFDRMEEIPGPFGPPEPRGSGETSATLNARVLAWLDGRTSSAPAFILAVSTDPMEPFGAPDPEGSHFLDAEELEWYRGVRRDLLAMRSGGLCLTTPEDLKRLKVDPERFSKAARGVYDGAVRYNDRQLRILRQGLEERGLWKKTLFVVTSTHGEEFGEGGMFGHGPSLYDPAVRVPVVMSYPPVVPRPRQMHKPADAVDLLPTLLSLLGLPLPGGMQGIERNVEATSETRNRYERPAFAETSPAGALPTGRAAMTVESGIKLIVYEEAPFGMERPEMELFRATDPLGWEKRSVLASVPHIASRRRAILQGWRGAKGTLLLPPDPISAARPARLQEVLRSLGYLQGVEPRAMRYNTGRGRP